MSSRKRWKLLTKEEFSIEEICVKKCQDTKSLSLSKEHTFKNAIKTFTLKTPMLCISFNVIYVVICSGCLEEYIGETGEGKTRLKDRFKVYRQQIKQFRASTIKT